MYLFGRNQAIRLACNVSAKSNDFIDLTKNLKLETDTNWPFLIGFEHHYESEAKRTVRFPALTSEMG